MWSSEQQEENNRVISSSSSTSWSYRSTSSSSTSVLPQTPRRGSMEEVWKDITLHQEPPNLSATPSHPHPHSIRGMIFQDFLAGPKATATATAASEEVAEEEELGPLPLPPTALSLNSSAMGFHHYGSTNIHPNNNNNNNNNSSSTNNPASFMISPASNSFGDAIIGSLPTPAAGLFSFCPKKRLLDSCPAAAFGGDRRHKRMMKNRESAARSRARKQAYTNELELEVAHLVEENQKLRKQHEELQLAMLARNSTKQTLQRTSTAPF